MRKPAHKRARKIIANKGQNKKAQFTQQIQPRKAEIPKASSSQVVKKQQIKKASNENTCPAKCLTEIYLKEITDSAQIQQIMQTHMTGLDNNNNDAIYELARCCLDSRVTDEQVRQIVQKYNFKQKLNELAKMCALGFVELDNDEALQLFIDVEDQHDPDVLTAIGRCCNFLWSDDESQKQAIQYYIKAAEFGSFEALERLRYFKYLRDEQLLIGTFNQFEQLADGCNANALFAVGFCYCYGIDVEQNKNLAIQMLLRAASGGCTNAIALLGDLYYHGNGIQQNEAMALHFYKLAAESGNVQAQYYLAEHCYHNADVDDARRYAALLYEKAAKQGHSQAAYDLAGFYDSGDVIGQDDIAAFKWYKQSALSGNGNAQFEVGSCYYDGKGTQQNYSDAAEWFQSAANQGDDDAIEMLVECFDLITDTQNGDQNVPDLSYSKPVSKTIMNKEMRSPTVFRFETALRLARIAACSGSAKALAWLGDCCFNGNIVRKNIVAAAENYQQALQLSEAALSVESLLNLVKCYSNWALPNKTELDAFTLVRQVYFFLTKQQQNNDNNADQDADENKQNAKTAGAVDFGAE